MFILVNLVGWIGCLGDLLLDDIHFGENIKVGGGCVGGSVRGFSF